MLAFEHNLIPVKRRKPTEAGADVAARANGAAVKEVLRAQPHDPSWADDVRVFRSALRIEARRSNSDPRQ